MTGNSNHKVLDAWGMTPPVEALRRQLLKETEDASPDIFRRGPGSAAWHRVLSTLVETLSTQIIEVRNSSDLGVPCPDCGIYFTNRASMLGHMSKKHADHKARPVNQTHGVFDKHEDALGGLPQCKHCKVKLCDFSSLCKHINEHRCRVLFPSRPYAPQTVGGQAWISWTEFFGPLAQEQLQVMEWTAMKREAEPDSALRRGAKPRGTEQGKGHPWNPAPGNKQRWRKGGGKGENTKHTNITYLVQPGNQGPLPLLFAAAQKWKKAQEEGATTTALRATLFGCLLQMLHTGLKDVGGASPTPFQTKGGDEVAEGRPLVLPEVVASPVEPGGRWGSSPPTARKACGGPTASAAAGDAAVHDPPLSRHKTPGGQHERDHSIPSPTAPRDTRQYGECMEALTGLSALQIIGLQLRRDTLNNLRLPR